MKQPGESVADYTAELRKIAEHCSFSESLEDILRDHLVCGISDPQLQRRLLAEADLTCKIPFEIAVMGNRWYQYKGSPEIAGFKFKS